MPSYVVWRQSLSDDWRGKWALITGASAGIGLELAKQLAAGGSHLVLTARRIDRLQQLAAELAGKIGVNVELFAADLIRSEAPEQIYEFTSRKKIEIELLVNNAGFGAFGYIHEIPAERMTGDDPGELFRVGTPDAAIRRRNG